MLVCSTTKGTTPSAHSSKYRKRLFEKRRYFPTRKKIGGVHRAKAKPRSATSINRAPKDDQSACGSRGLYCRPISKAMPDQNANDIRWARATERTKSGFRLDI